MTKGNPQWEQFERAVQILLGLRSTPGSGNQWHAPSDGVSTSDDSYKLMVDCKHTQRPSYSLNLAMLNQWHEQATMLGFHFALPVRMEGLGAERNKTRHKEWVTVPLDDYAEIVGFTRSFFDLSEDFANRCGDLSPQRGDRVCCRRPGHFGHHDNGRAEWS